jgi:hypothetical protein
MRPALVIIACLFVAGCGGGDSGASPATAAKAAPPPPSGGPCAPARVHRPPYAGHGKGLETLPWIAGRPRSAGLVGLVWFASPGSGGMRVWAGGQAPDGSATKMLWVFLGRDAVGKAGIELRVQGRRMDGRGTFADSFAGVGYEGSDGAPSYASIMHIPRPGCWRLTLTTGSLRAFIDVRAIRAPGSG